MQYSCHTTAGQGSERFGQDNTDEVHQTHFLIRVHYAASIMVEDRYENQLYAGCNESQLL